MKFIGGINTFKIKANGEVDIKIINYHRAATGLLTNARVYVYPRITGNTKEAIHEIIISPFKPERWDKIWKLEFSTIDRPGLIRDISAVLSEEDINIFVQESLLTNRNQDFSVTVIGNFTHFLDKLPKDANNRIETWQSEGLSYLKSKFVENLKDIELLSFDSIKYLTNLSYETVLSDNKNESQIKINSINWNKLKDYYHKKSRVVKKKSIILQDEIVKDLELKNLVNESGTIQGAVFSDTEDKFMIVRFFRPSQMVAHLQIKHENKSGAIYEFTHKICEKTDNKYNIIGSYNRIEDDNEIAFWHVLLDVTSDPSQLKSLIEDLGKLELVKEISPKEYTENLKRACPNLPRIRKKRFRIKNIFSLIVSFLLFLSLFVNVLFFVTRTENNIFFFNQISWKIWLILSIAIGSILPSIYYIEHFYNKLKKYF